MSGYVPDALLKKATTARRSKTPESDPSQQCHQRPPGERLPQQQQPTTALEQTKPTRPPKRGSSAGMASHQTPQRDLRARRAHRGGPRAQGGAELPQPLVRHPGSNVQHRIVRSGAWSKVSTKWSSGRSRRPPRASRPSATGSVRPTTTVSVRCATAASPGTPRQGPHCRQHRGCRRSRE